MNIKRDFVLREIAGEFILVPVADSALELNGLIMLNEVGRRIWELLPVCENVEALISTLLDEYEVDGETLRADVDEFMKKLQKLDII